MEQHINQITLRGELQALPVFSHENHGRKFYRFYLEVPRLSGAVDTLPVITELGVLEQIDLLGGGKLMVEGQIRSHNHTDETGRHLMVFVYATSVIAQDGEPINQTSLSGILCREPVYRRTPLGREICDVMLAVPRSYRKADYLPCILWGRLAKEMSLCHTRDQIQINGRLQSRVYSKFTGETTIERTAYEISALTAHILEDPV